MKAADLKSKSREELQNELNALLKEQFSLRMQDGLGEMPRSHQFKQTRRNIARVKTVLNEKARQEKVTGNE